MMAEEEWTMMTGGLAERAADRAAYDDYLAAMASDNSAFRAAFRDAFFEALPPAPAQPFFYRGNKKPAAREFARPGCRFVRERPAYAFCDGCCGRYLSRRYSVNAPQVYTCLRKKPKCRYMGPFSRESVSSTTAG